MVKIGCRGFVITVDAFLGVTLILLFAVLAFFYMSKVSLNSWNTIDQRNLVFDEASILEKSLALENSVINSSSEEILSFLNQTPQGYCFEVTIYSSPDLSPKIHSIKTGCVKSADEYISIDRSFVVRDSDSVSYYIARVSGWSK
jgi:hypothetical protein